MISAENKKQIEIPTKRIYLHSKAIQKIESIVGHRLTKNVEDDILKAIEIGGRK